MAAAQSRIQDADFRRRDCPDGQAPVARSRPASPSSPRPTDVNQSALGLIGSISSHVPNPLGRPVSDQAAIVVWPPSTGRSAETWSVTALDASLRSARSMPLPSYATVFLQPSETRYRNATGEGARHRGPAEQALHNRPLEFPMFSINANLAHQRRPRPPRRHQRQAPAAPRAHLLRHAHRQRPGRRGRTGVSESLERPPERASARPCATRTTASPSSRSQRGAAKRSAP